VGDCQLSLGGTLEHASGPVSVHRPAVELRAWAMVTELSWAAELEGQVTVPMIATRVSTGHDSTSFRTARPSSTKRGPA